MGKQVTIGYFGLQAGTDRTVFVQWNWAETHTDHYQVRWYYNTGDQMDWYVGNDGTTEFKQSTYTAPENAKRVRVIIRPVSTTYKSTDGKTDIYYWKADWSTEKIYNFSNNPPVKPSVPTVEIDNDKDTLTASLENLDSNTEYITFQVIQDNNANKVYDIGRTIVRTGHAYCSWPIALGHEYKVRCKSERAGIFSSWTEYSSNLKTRPLSTNITTCKPNTKTSVQLEWKAVQTATSYSIEGYKKGSPGEDGQTISQTGITETNYIWTGLETGAEYMFKVKAVNDVGESDWSPIKGVKIGTKPGSPTTWSSTTTATQGDPVNLYWQHNSEDGSSQTLAKVWVKVNDALPIEYLYNDTSTADDEKTTSHKIVTTSMPEGATITWKVQTAGIYSQNQPGSNYDYGPWSIERTIKVYAKPALQLRITDSADSVVGGYITEYPFYIKATQTIGNNASSNQTPLSYHVVITAKQSYETYDNFGNETYVTAGTEIYSKHISAPTQANQLSVKITPSDVRLENNILYGISVIVSMSSGLTAQAWQDVTTNLDDYQYDPNASIGIDKSTLSAYITPYLHDQGGDLVTGATLSVYRREYDGSFTEIAKDIPNNYTTVTDPHPSLDFARYRIVATEPDAGCMSYHNIYGHEIGEKSIIIQWDEKWTNFESTTGMSEEPSWAGSMLKLPYNIDITESKELEYSLINYAGRKHPVSYYGIHVGETASWSTEIPKDDKETIYALRRLAAYAGDVYVREPSGIGYWANIKISFSQTHREITIPVTLDITRVEGGA